MLESLRSKIFTADRPDQMAAAAGLDANGLLEAIVCEIHLAALHAAVVGSGLNALRAGGSLKAPAALKNFLPGGSGVVAGLLSAHEEAGIDASTMLTLKSFFGELTSARSHMEHYLAALDAPAADHVPKLNYAASLKQWSQICQHALDAVSVLDGGSLKSLPAYYSQNSAMLMKLLPKVIDGQQPCLDAEGNLVLPDLPQRRRTARRSLLQECTLRHKGKVSSVIAKDISMTGLGLERTPELKVQELVQIELVGGRKLMGLVVWASGSSAGVRLGKPLLPNDPLLTG